MSARRGLAVGDPAGQLHRARRVLGRRPRVQRRQPLHMIPAGAEPLLGHPTHRVAAVDLWLAVAEHLGRMRELCLRVDDSRSRCSPARV